MDAARVERAVLQGWYWENHDSCRFQNRFYAECLRLHPDRLSACATFHPSAGEQAVLAELTWARQNGFCGVGEMSPHSQGFSVSDPVWNAALAQADILHFPVVLHVTEALSWRTEPAMALLGANPVTETPDIAEERATLARQIIEGALERFGAKGEVQIVAGEPTTEILKLVETLPAELLVVGTRGRGSVSRVMLGSVAADLVQSAPCSVLAVRLTSG